ncbi:glycosyltransferase [Robiginitalea sediminis]|uniref:glycosyltransferase n=1 Tax=Robiginitalea sediminis TaxID=1982593 RepID=UPI000B4A7401|nr:glycosyltransferase [Robiginitalea sediminis]
MSTPSLAIVIPCYNEYGRLYPDRFRGFLSQHPDAFICFVDDASTDRTPELLEGFRAEFPGQVAVCTNPSNTGKAGAVRHGVLYAHQHNLAPALAYLDADLATSLEECYSYLPSLEEKSFLFASRILIVGSEIERTFMRFFVGRVIATAISNILNLKVYDTQCGCKVFRSELAPLLFGEPFVSRWLFDVELFSRILSEYGPEKGEALMREIPVRRWIDQGESKVRITYGFRLWWDLLRIGTRHRRAMKPWRNQPKPEQ